MWSPLATPWRAPKILEGTACAGKVLFVWPKFREPLNLSSLISWLTSTPASPTISGIYDPFVHIESLYVWHMDPANWCKKMQKKGKTRKTRKKKRMLKYMWSVHQPYRPRPHSALKKLRNIHTPSRCPNSNSFARAIAASTGTGLDKKFDPTSYVLISTSSPRKRKVCRDWCMCVPFSPW